MPKRDYYELNVLLYYIASRVSEGIISNFFLGAAVVGLVCCIWQIIKDVREELK